MKEVNVEWVLQDYLEDYVAAEYDSYEDVTGWKANRLVERIGTTIPPEQIADRIQDLEEEAEYHRNWGEGWMAEVCEVLLDALYEAKKA